MTGDGRVTNWVLVKTSLWHNDVTKIVFTGKLDNFGEKYSCIQDLPDGRIPWTKTLRQGQKT